MHRPKDLVMSHNLLQVREGHPEYCHLPYKCAEKQQQLFGWFQCLLPYV